MVVVLKIVGLSRLWKTRSEDNIVSDVMENRMLLTSCVDMTSIQEYPKDGDWL